MKDALDRMIDSGEITEAHSTSRLIVCAAVLFDTERPCLNQNKKLLAKNPHDAESGDLGEQREEKNSRGCEGRWQGGG